MKSVVFFVALIAGAAVCGCGGASNPSDQRRLRAQIVRKEGITSRLMPKAFRP